MARILVACESSGAVRDAFRALGHDAISCDLLPADVASPYHYQGDVTPLLSARYRWDLIVAFPPCTHLASSGARHFAAKRADGRQAAGIAFARLFLDLPESICPRVAVENPVGILSTVVRKPTQIIQPWQFGHGETKATCLWLRNLPALTPTNVVSGREARIHRMAPSPLRWKLRSATYPGIAAAMADQWSAVLP